MAGGVWFGVDVFHEDIADNFEHTVWEPSLVKINALTAAAESAALILSVDETVKNPTSQIVCSFLCSHILFSRTTTRLVPRLKADNTLVCADVACPAVRILFPALS